MALGCPESNLADSVSSSHEEKTGTHLTRRVHLLLQEPHKKPVIRTLGELVVVSGTESSKPLFLHVYKPIGNLPDGNSVVSIDTFYDREYVVGELIKIGFREVPEGYQPPRAYRISQNLLKNISEGNFEDVNLTGIMSNIN